MFVDTVSSILTCMVRYFLPISQSTVSHMLPGCMYSWVVTTGNFSKLSINLSGCLFLGLEFLTFVRVKSSITLEIPFFSSLPFLFDAFSVDHLTSCFNFHVLLFSIVSLIMLVLWLRLSFLISCLIIRLYASELLFKFRFKIMSCFSLLRLNLDNYIFHCSLLFFVIFHPIISYFQWCNFLFEFLLVFSLTFPNCFCCWQTFLNKFTSFLIFFY